MSPTLRPPLNPEFSASDPEFSSAERFVWANIRVRRHPAYGQSRDVAGAIVDETRAVLRRRPRDSR